MKLIFFLLIIVAFIFSMTFRFFVFHPFKVIYNLFNDLYDFIFHKKWNECKEFGKVIMFTAQDSQAFGCGKSLTMVKLCNDINNKYDNVDVWDYDSKSWVKQHIYFISNLELKDVNNYIAFTSKDQFKNVHKMNIGKHDVLFFVLDEAGIVFNSREYKTNLPTEFIQKLLQVRHYKIGFITNAQRFQMVDKVFREISNTVTTCKKKWRFIYLCEYDAYELENAVNPSLLAPKSRRLWFSTNSDYNSYDTNYNVDTLLEELDSGNIMTTDEILALRGDTRSDLDAVIKLKKRFKLRKNK